MFEKLKQNPKIFNLVWAIRGLFGITPKSVNEKYFLNKTKNIIPEYLKQYPSVRKLNIGAQIDMKESWLSVDIWPAKIGIAYLDATKKFCLEDASFDYIFSEHMIEHITLQEGFFMLQECSRILKSGGKIRIATPCLDKLIDDIDASDKLIISYFNRFVKPVMANNIAIGIDRAYFINYLTYNYEHKFLYNKKAIEQVLLLAGFTNIIFHKPSESNDVHLENLEIHHQYLGKEFNDFETMVVEAIKP